VEEWTVTYLQILLFAGVLGTQPLQKEMNGSICHM